MKPDGPAAVSGSVDLGDILYEIDGVKVLYGIGPNGRPLSNIEVPPPSTLTPRLKARNLKSGIRDLQPET